MIRGPPRPSISFPRAGGKGSVWLKSPSCRRLRGWDSGPRVQIGEPRGGPGRSPRAWSQRGQRGDHLAPEARCRRCPTSSPHQPSASLHHDPPLPPAVITADPSGAGHPAPIQDLSLPPPATPELPARHVWDTCGSGVIGPVSQPQFSLQPWERGWRQLRSPLLDTARLVSHPQATWGGWSCSHVPVTTLGAQRVPGAALGQPQQVLTSQCPRGGDAQVSVPESRPVEALHPPCQHSTKGSWPQQAGSPRG